MENRLSMAYTLLASLSGLYWLAAQREGGGERGIHYSIEVGMNGIGKSKSEVRWWC